MTYSRLVAPALLIAAAFASLLALPTANAQDKRPGVMAVLTSKIDTKSAKVGDTVTAETTEKTKLQDGAQIPRGAKLIGVITEVTTVKDDNGMSMLGLKFQQIVVKHDPPIAIHGGLVAVAPPPDASGELPTSSTTVRAQGLQTQGNYGHNDDADSGLPAGSTVNGVGLSTTIGSDGTTELQGNHTEIKLDRGSRLRVALL
ncbi:MAG: hypothetical protein ACLQHF_07060 [Terracidiphilus sp.]